MKNIFLLAVFYFTLFSCNSDSSNSDEYSIVGNWVIEELTKNGTHVFWGACGHLENMSFYDDKTYTWELYAIADEFDSCIPIPPPADGIWEQIDNDTIKLIDDDIIFEADYNRTHLYMNFFIDPTNEDPEGIHIRFVFLRS